MPASGLMSPAAGTKLSMAWRGAQKGTRGKIVKGFVAITARDYTYRRGRDEVGGRRKSLSVCLTDERWML